MTEKKALFFRASEAPAFGIFGKRNSLSFIKGGIRPSSPSLSYTFFVRFFSLLFLVHRNYRRLERLRSKAKLLKRLKRYYIIKFSYRTFLRGIFFNNLY